MENRTKYCKNIVWNIILAITLLGFSALTFIMFNRQAAVTTGPAEIVPYLSDMPDYVRDVAGISTNYSFPYRFFFWISRLFAMFAGAATGTAIATTLLNSLSVLLTWYYLHRFFAENIPEVKRKMRNEKLGENLFEAATLFITFSLYLISNLYSWTKGNAFLAFDRTIMGRRFLFYGFDYIYRCLGSYTPNPWWNATYLATRPFTLICFFEGIRILKAIGNRADLGVEISVREFDWKGSILFAVGLFLTTFTKPSFTMVFLPTLALFMIVELIRSKGVSLQGMFAWCLTMIPTGLILIYEFGNVFTGTNVMGEETGMALSLGTELGRVWKLYTWDIRVSLISVLILPIGVLVLNLTTFFSNKWYRFAWIQYLVSTVMFLCLYEKGFRESHANFSWGYMHGLFFLYLMTLIMILKNIRDWFRSWKLIFLIPELAVFGWYLACGIKLFLYFWNGGILVGF